MGLIRKFYPIMILVGVTVALLLRFMMWEFDTNGLSYLAVVSGFFAIGICQMAGFYFSEKIHELPKPWTYW